MKKLLIALAAVLTAASMQALTLSWASYYVTELDDGGIADGTYWLVDLGTSNDVGGFKMYEDGTYDFGSGKVLSTGAAATEMGDEVKGLSAADNGKYFALVVWDNLDSENSGMWGVATAQVTAGVDDPPADPDMVEFTNGSDNLGTVLWLDQAVLAKDTPVPPPPPIPEPTTYALIGVAAAALALRKRFMKK